MMSQWITAWGGWEKAFDSPRLVRGQGDCAKKQAGSQCGSLLELDCLSNTPLCSGVTLLLVSSSLQAWRYQGPGDPDSVRGQPPAASVVG